MHPIGAITRGLGMSTARWMALPAVMLEVAELRPTQDVELGLWLAHRRSQTRCADPCVHAVRLAGVTYLEDGHHRWARARLRGDRLIAGRLLVAP